MKHLKLFTTEVAFDAAKDNIEKPYVTLTEDDSKVHYTEQDEPQPTYEMVDLGLPSGLKWAAYNIGASKPEEYGDYFMWGSTTPNTDSNCSWVNTPHQTQNTTSASSTKFTKYLGSTSSSYKDPSATDENALKTVLDPMDDAATQIWGASYRMPTKEDFDELLANTNKEWITNYNGSGVNGYLFRSQKDMDKYIFIPASGSRSGSSFLDQGSFGYVWSSSLYSGSPYYGRNLVFISGYCGMGSDSRGSGFCVRPVSAK